MNNRLLDIIRYKTGGKQSEFAALPEINAWWLLTGEGEMIEPRKYTDLRRTMLESILPVFDLEKYMPVMTPQELHDFEQVIQGRRKSDSSPELLEKWQGLLQLREDEISAKIKSAMHKSEIVCKRKKVNK